MPPPSEEPRRGRLGVSGQTVERHDDIERHDGLSSRLPKDKLPSWSKRAGPSAVDTPKLRLGVAPQRKPWEGHPPEDLGTSGYMHAYKIVATLRYGDTRYGDTGTVIMNLRFTRRG